jgi:hypothetical protein
MAVEWSMIKNNDRECWDIVYDGGEMQEHDGDGHRSVLVARVYDLDDAKRIKQLQAEVERLTAEPKECSNCGAYESCPAANDCLVVADNKRLTDALEKIANYYGVCERFGTAQHGPSCIDYNEPIEDYCMTCTAKQALSPEKEGE